jgi:hypothetical protein
MVMFRDFGGAHVLRILLVNNPHYREREVYSQNPETSLKGSGDRYRARTDTACRCHRADVVPPLDTSLALLLDVDGFGLWFGDYERFSAKQERSFVVPPQDDVSGRRLQAA